MAVTVYFWLNAALYLAFAVLCTLRNTGAAAASGYLSLDGSGRSEYLTVYGGMQLGLAGFYAVLASNAEHHRIGLLFSVLVYGAIVVFRMVTIGLYAPVSRLTKGIAAMELLLLIGAVVLLARHGSPVAVP